VKTRNDNLAEAGRAKAATPLRVFFALWPDEVAGERITALARDVVRRAGCRALRPENIHLTIAFVGDVTADRIAALEAIGAAAARESAPFVLLLDRLGAFRSTGIAWLGTDVPPLPLVHLVDTLRQGLAADRFPVEQRSYRAHVTLARRCSSVAAATIVPVVWPVERLTLMASELHPAGSRYRELAAWALA
jgi:RNA 2',3'-cyclic 3'-phosphodiesterase